MSNIDFDKLAERSQVGIQTIAVVFLGWLATSISSLEHEIKDLNSKMITIVEITKYHERRIEEVEESIKTDRIKIQSIQLKFYDEFDKLRDKIRGIE